MGDAAVAGANFVDYVGVGTIEFLLDKNKDFYFMEMNTRIQVEHPITEMVTGVDLIKWQIKMHAGEKFPEYMKQIKLRLHSIECRINAEDPSKNFQPCPGTIGICHQPSGFRTRVDGSIYQGYKVTPYYDSMVCKLICHGRNRNEAIQRMLRSLDEFVFLPWHINLQTILS
jgi:acetyl-CoA carboxylase biotin carboxylase subunit